MTWITLSLALANGGPDDWTHPTAIGSARPTAEVRTQLVSEKLTVTMGEDYDEVHARAVYTLRNPKKTETVRYAVPILNELFEDFPEDQFPEAAGHEAKVSLTLDGKPLSCTKRPLEKPISLPFAHKKRINPDALENPPDHPVWDEQITEFKVGTACDVELTLTKGDHELVLDVVEEPLHYSWSTSKDKHAGTSDRTWIWLLSPAGGWAGNVEKLMIDVDLGPHAGTATVHGEEWSAEGSHRRKTLSNVDLGTLEPLKIDLGVRDQDFQKIILQRMGNDYAWKPLGAKASSTLKAQGSNSYDPANLIDRDPATAWCEGVDGTGVGEWIELRYTPLVKGQAPAYLQPGGIALQMAIIPGYAKSASTWTTNGRIAKLEVSACDGSAAHTMEVPRKDDPRAALWFTGFGEDIFSHDLPPIATAITDRWAESGEPACIKVRLVEVEPGSKYTDTCISELGFQVDSPG